MKNQVMKKSAAKNNAGFSLLELVISMTITLVLMAMAGAIFSHSIGTRETEARRTQAITAAQNALNLISREVANSGYGLTDNGIVAADSNQQKLHFRSNIKNTDAATSGAGEDLTYFLDASSNAIVRYDRFATPQTSTVIDRVENLSFQYWDYTGAAGNVTSNNVPSANTARIRISVTVRLDPVEGQPENQDITYTSDVTLRNSKYISKQY